MRAHVGEFVWVMTRPDDDVVRACEFLAIERDWEPFL